MITRRQGLLMLLASQSASKAQVMMDAGMPAGATLPDTLAVAINPTTKNFQVQADGRVVTFTVAEMMNALGAKRR